MYRFNRYQGALSPRVLTEPRLAAKTPYSPISQSSNTLPPVAVKQQRWRPLERTTNNRPKSFDDSTVAADSQVVSCDRFSYQQLIRFTSTMQAPEGTRLFEQEQTRRPIQNAQLKHIPSQYILIDRHINSSVQVKLVYNQERRINSRRRRTRLGKDGAAAVSLPCFQPPCRSILGRALVLSYLGIPVKGGPGH